LISIIHPTRSRPQKSYKTTLDWLRKASTEVELIVSIDESDQYIQQYWDLYKDKKVVINPNRSAVDAVNNAAKESTGDILIVVSDDSSCPHNWDKIILDAVQGKTDFVLKVHDNVQDWIVTMPILDREYYNRFGYVYHPEYFHQFVDTEFTHVADITGKIIWRNDIVFPHLHYSVTKERRDPLYERNDNSTKAGMVTYLRRFRENFGLQNVNVWEINGTYGKGHYQWLKNNA
jgi:glycosyltransferase involved in cell wall biosynthesis